MNNCNIGDNQSKSFLNYLQLKQSAWWSEKAEIWHFLALNYQYSVNSLGDLVEGGKSFQESRVQRVKF